MQPSCARPLLQLGEKAGHALGPQPDGDAVDADIDPLDQKLDNAGLLGRKEFVPEWIQLDEGGSDFRFADAAVVCSRGRPGFHDHLGRPKQRPKLVDDRSLDLACPNGNGCGSFRQY